jgi:hypothetical protein
MRASKPLRISHAAARRERGATTLFVTLIILIILTLIILASTNVALFEQKTASNENRQHLAEQAAEYALTLGGEYLKSNVVNVASNEDDDGWLKTGGTNLHWQLCPASPTAGHPCWAERDPGVRQNLYYYVKNGVATTDPTSTNLDLPLSNIPPTAGLTKVGPRDLAGTPAFDVSTRVRALLCRLDTTTGQTPTCQANPSTGNRIAFTLVASSTMSGENSAADVKETWGSISNFSATSAVPLVASGVVKGLGNASIVASANAGGYGLAASIWSPNDVDVDGSGANICGVKSGGVGSVTTCHMGDYLGDVPAAELETTCAGHGNTGCGCSNVAKDSPDALSGHFGGSFTQETYDVLDVDSSHGSPDISFFPGTTCGNVRMDHRADGGTKTCLATQPSCFTDDNLFEWIFNQDVTGVDGSGLDVVGYPITSAINDKEVAALKDLGAEVVADCTSLDTKSEGLIYVTGDCSLKDDVGSPDNPVVLVADGPVKVTGNFNLYGMLFVRDAGAGASFKGAGSVNIFGSVIVEGDVDMAGSLNIIYVESTGGKPGSKLKASTTFARLTGSWLDAAQGF